MKTRFHVSTLVVAATLGFFAATSSGQVQLLMEGDPPGSIRTDNYSFGAGYGFYVPADIGTTINALGFWDEGGDGLLSDHVVALYQFAPGSGLGSDYNLMAAVTVPAGTGAQLIGGYRWISISDLFLPDNGQGGNYYAILATQGGGDPWTDMNDAPTLNVEMGIFSSRSLVGELSGQTLGQDPIALVGGGVPAYGGANMAYIAVPEPGTVSLSAVAALAGICGMRWRSRNSRP